MRESIATPRAEASDRLYDMVGGEIFWYGANDGTVTDTYAAWPSSTGPASGNGLHELEPGKYEVRAKSYRPSKTWTGQQELPNVSSLFETAESGVDEYVPARWVGVAFQTPREPYVSFQGGKEEILADPTPETIVDIWERPDGSVLATNIRYRPLTMNVSRYSGRTAWAHESKDTAPLVIRTHHDALESLVMPFRGTNARGQGIDETMTIVRYDMGDEQ